MEGQRTVTRPLDELERVVIPADIHEAWGWGVGTKLEIAINDVTAKSLIVREASPSCSLCGAQQPEGLVKIEKGYICPECAGKIK